MKKHEINNGSLELNANNGVRLNTKITPISKVVQCFKFVFVSYFSYSTVKEVKINNFFIGFVFRIIQTILLVYIIGYYFC
jgi:hypothetical protein